LTIAFVTSSVALLRGRHYQFRTIAARIVDRGIDGVDVQQVVRGGRQQFGETSPVHRTGMEPLIPSIPR
jgi:hypothetical protein